MRAETSIIAELPGQEKLEWRQTDQGPKLFAIASQETLRLIRAKQQQSPDVLKWSLPQGNSTGEILLRELILKVQKLWNFPVQEIELCHCRKVPTAKVDQAIVAGAHQPDKIRRLTSANTSCGTCLPEIETLLKFRLR